MSLGSFEELVLLMVAVLHEQAYGVAIRDELLERLDRKVHISAVHSCLNRLEKKGFIRSEMGRPTSVRGGRRKRLFTLTSSGKDAVRQTREVRERAWNQIPDIVWQFSG